MGFADDIDVSEVTRVLLVLLFLCNNTAITRRLFGFIQTVSCLQVCGPPSTHVSSDHNSGANRDAGALQVEIIAQTLALNAINFCYYPDMDEPRWFWQHPDGTLHGEDDEYNGVTEALTNARLAGVVQLSSGDWLRSNVTTDLMKQILRPADSAGTLPLLAARAECWVDLGRGLCVLDDSNDNGEEGVRALLLRSGWPDEPSAVKFVGWLCAASPSWYDRRRYKCKSSSSSEKAGSAVAAKDGGVSEDPKEAPFEVETEIRIEVEAAFLKRAQLCASLLDAIGAVNWIDMHELTAFSDYRLPQLFRAHGILKLESELERRIEAGELIPEGSEEEVEL